MLVIVEPLEVPSSSERAPAPTEGTASDVVHPEQYGIAQKRIALPRQDDEILSGHDQDVLSTQDGYAIWGFTDPGFALLRHLVTSGSAKPVFRCAHDRRLSSPKPEYRFDNNRPNRLLEQTRLSVLSWNPGPRRGREGAIEEHIAGKWHVIALQEAIEYLQHPSRIISIPFGSAPKLRLSPPLVFRPSSASSWSGRVAWAHTFLVPCKRRSGPTSPT